MLQGLDEIDWAALSHAHGSAADVPELLRVASKGDELEREEAFTELSASIWHQGTVYEATSHAVPFLYQLLPDAPRAEDRISILSLLSLVARGAGDHQQHGKGTPEQLEKERAWVEAAHQAVRREVRATLGCLRDPHPDVRLHAALLCASVPEAAEETRDSVRSALERERGLQVRAGLGLALAVLGRFVPEAFDSEDDDLPLERLSALARRLSKGETDARIALELLQDLAEQAFDETRLDELGVP